MEQQKRIDTFSLEIGLIQNNAIRELVKEALCIVPEYFFTVPASSTGKYHPQYSLGDGGLVRHTQAATRIAYELFRIDMFKYSQLEQDIMLAALILHDTCKSGLEHSQYTKAEHPLIAAKLIREHDFLFGNEYKEDIAKCIETHMGQWNTDYKTHQAILPLPQTKMQKFVHLCDYLASRKCLEVNFNAELSAR